MLSKKKPLRRREYICGGVGCIFPFLSWACNFLLSRQLISPPLSNSCNDWTRRPRKIAFQETLFNPGLKENKRERVGSKKKKKDYYYSRRLLKDIRLTTTTSGAAAHRLSAAAAAGAAAAPRESGKNTLPLPPPLHCSGDGFSISRKKGKKEGRKECCLRPPSFLIFPPPPSLLSSHLLSFRSGPGRYSLHCPSSAAISSILLFYGTYLLGPGTHAPLSFFSHFFQATLASAISHELSPLLTTLRGKNPIGVQDRERSAYVLYNASLHRRKNML